MYYEAQEAPRSVPESTESLNPTPDTPQKIEHNLVAKNVPNRTSLRAAVNAMCAHCMGCTAEHMEPGFKSEIRNCTAAKCPLWHFRPYKP